jgi:hypothetical protein
MRLVVRKPSLAASEAASKLLDEASMACAAAIGHELPGMEPATAVALLKALSNDVMLSERTEEALIAADWPARSPGSAQRAQYALAQAGLHTEAVERLKQFSDGTL